MSFLKLTSRCVFLFCFKGEQGPKGNLGAPGVPGTPVIIKELSISEQVLSKSCFYFCIHRAKEKPNGSGHDWLFWGRIFHTV